MCISLFDTGHVRDENLGHASLNDKQRSGRPPTATDEAQRNRISQQETANRTAVACEKLWLIIGKLGYREWWTDICRQLFRCEREGDEFVCNVVSGRRNLGASFRSRDRNGIPSQRLNCTKEVEERTFCWKSHAHCFLGHIGAVHSDFMPTGATFNSDCYVGTLQRLKACIRTVRPGM
jgi:hypothetical protein